MSKRSELGYVDICLTNECCINCLFHIKRKTKKATKLICTLISSKRNSVLPISSCDKYTKALKH